MHNRPHSIGKQIFEVELSSNTNGFSIRQEFTDLVKKSLLSVIEEVLDDLDPKNVLLRLEKIEVELTKISYPFNEEDIKNQLRRSLSEDLNFRIVSIRHQHKNRQSSLNESLLSFKETEEEWLLYFFQYGTLPWWYSESKNHIISIEERIQQLSRTDPKIVYSILSKLNHGKEPLRRFITHCPESIFFELIASFTNSTVTELIELQSFLPKSGLQRYIQHFNSVLKEFMILYFVFEKQKIKSSIVFLFSFIEYTLQQKYIKQDQLSELFPDYLVVSWLEYHFPGMNILLQEYFKKSFIASNSQIKEPMNDFFLRALLKLRFKSSNDIEEIKQKLKIKVNPEFKESSIDNSFSNHSFEFENRSDDYFSFIGKKIIQYLVYGIISWEDRAAGIVGIEALIFKFHQQNPERLKKLIAEIEQRSYPIVQRRVEQNFEKETSDLFFEKYFDKELAIQQLISVKYKDKIIRTFFENGIAPWEEVIGNNIKHTENVIRTFYQQDPSYFLKVLKTYLKNSAQFLRRIESTYSSDFIDFLKEIIKKEISPSESMKETGMVMKEDIPNDIDLIVYYLTYFELNKRLPVEVTFHLNELVEYFIEHYSRQAKLYFILAYHQESFILKQNFPYSIIEKINQWIKPEDSKYLNITKKNKNSDDNPIDTPIVVELNDPIYLVNAGLVLIHPFLQRFFSLCNLLDKRKFKDEQSTRKALHLLHYIVFKIEKPEEHQVVLNKLLCGIPLSEPIDRTIELSPEEKETCESLIRGVVENWPILKKTSNENFRISLLQREGRLMKEEGVWRLKVEERSYDMLLDKLPWTIYMIKLPWMEKMLQVEWR